MERIDKNEKGREEGEERGKGRERERGAVHSQTNTCHMRGIEVD